MRELDDVAAQAAGDDEEQTVIGRPSLPTTTAAASTDAEGSDQHGCCECNLFYGWFVVAFAGFAIILSFPGCSFGIAFFLPSLRSALALSHTEIALVWGGGILIVAAMLPAVGHAVDRLQYGTSQVVEQELPDAEPQFPTG